ncbi:MAG TPA: hypothetical protein VKW78_12355 [Terriglobales bacterium]|jgi:hypothetical protein|nr:hypothetical protein [Terriglobales bacterium]
MSLEATRDTTWHNAVFVKVYLSRVIRTKESVTFGWEELADTRLRKGCTPLDLAAFGVEHTLVSGEQQP